MNFIFHHAIQLENLPQLCTVSSKKYSKTEAMGPNIYDKYMHGNLQKAKEFIPTQELMFLQFSPINFKKLKDTPIKRQNERKTLEEGH